MKIILLKEVQGLGHAGEVKEVAEGYARNFLITKGFADFATKHSLNVSKAQKNKRERVKKLEIRSKKLEAKKINGKSFTITAKADEKGSLYAKINGKTIAYELTKQGVKIEENEIKMPESIKKTGEHEIDLELSGESVKIKLEVASEK